ncbi:MAG: glycosyltransferase [bacterium]|nr:glycosyltransferase [bacterium]
MSLLRIFFSHTIVRFIISGSIAALVYFTLLYIFTDIIGLWYLFSSVVTYILSFSVSFVLQKFWTFRDVRMEMRIVIRQLVLQFIIAIGMLLLHTAALFVLVDVIGLWYLFAATISAFVLGILSFFIYRIFIFNITPHISILKTSAVLIATGLYPPNIGGPATYSKLLEEELPNHGITPTVVSFGSVRQFPKLIRHFVYFLKVVANSETVQVIYAQDPVSVGFPALLAARILGKKYILKIVGDYAWEQYQAQSEKRKAKSAYERFVTVEEFQKQRFDFITEARRWIEHFVARHADVVIVPSNYLKTIVISWGVRREKIQVIYNSFDLPATVPDKKSIRERLHLHGTIILSAGRFVPWKGFDALIEVVADLKEKIPNIKLYTAGDGPEKKNLELRIKNYELSNTVFLVGRLSHDALIEYIQAADIFVLNTGYEGFSHQLLEVMALGVPIITTHVGGNPELIENLKTGILVSYNNKSEIKNAIELLVKDGELRERLAQSGKEKVKEFTKERTLQELVQLF